MTMPQTSRHIHGYRGRMEGTCICGFTLIELLVVVTIIALLASITMPVIGRSREAARRAKCLANLRGIGQALEAYVSTNNDFYPVIAQLPSIEEVYALREQRNARPSLAEVLTQYAGNQAEVFICPSDTITQQDLQDMDHYPDDTERFADMEGASYEPRSLMMGHLVTTGSPPYRYQPFQIGGDDWSRLQGTADSVMLYDYNDFHGPADKFYSRLALYVDGHADGISALDGADDGDG